MVTARWWWWFVKWEPSKRHFISSQATMLYSIWNANRLHVPVYKVCVFVCLRRRIFLRLALKVLQFLKTGIQEYLLSIYAWVTLYLDRAICYSVYCLFATSVCFWVWSFTSLNRANRFVTGILQLPHLGRRNASYWFFFQCIWSDMNLKEGIF